MATLWSPTDENIRLLSRRLGQGDPVVFPTETVYGMGADATNALAVKTVYELKNRPAINPLIIHYARVETLKKDVIWNEMAETLANIFWPGPLTLILPLAKASKLSREATAGLCTAAVRIPRQATALALLEAFGGPVVAPSANPSGYLSPTTAEHVCHMFHDQRCDVLDGGKTVCGIESTVIDLTGDTAMLLRQGALAEELIWPYCTTLQLMTDVTADNDKKPRSPGLLLKHYAPRKPIRLGIENPQSGEALIYFGKQKGQGAAIERNLSSEGDVGEAASNLFYYLHEMDNMPEVRSIAIQPLPKTGVGKGVMDRLERAVRAKKEG